MSVRRGVPRPVSFTKPALSLLAVTAALLAIARTTGSGWLVVLLAVIAAVGVLAVVLPVPAVVRARVELEAPADATVGRPLRLTVAVAGTRRPMVVRVRESDGAWTAVAPPVRGLLEATPVRRGIVEELTVETRCGAPLGLVWWGRRHCVALGRPLEVGPAPLSTSAPAPRGRDAAVQQERAAARGGDELVRGTRDYAPGDPIKTVHWAATAHHGRLMVREQEATTAPPVVVAADLSAGGDAAERAASRAAGVVLAALSSGAQVHLLTHEAGGPVAGEVRTPVEASRRLARAVAGAPSALRAAAAGAPVVWVDGEGARA